MEWLLLIVLVPTIVVPIVLLCGFAGCAQIAGIDDSPATPSPPSFLNAKAIDTNHVKLDWDWDFSSTFRVERAPDTGSFAKVKDGIPGRILDDNPTTGLVEGTNFRYRVVKTQDGSTSSPSAEARVTTLPNAPTNLVATLAAPGQVDLAWDNTSTKADKFRVERRSPPGVGMFKALAPLVTAKTFPHRDATLLTAGSSHEYQVIAIVTNGFDNNVLKAAIESKPSPSLTVSIPAA